MSDIITLNIKTNVTNDLHKKMVNLSDREYMNVMLKEINFSPQYLKNVCFRLTSVQIKNLLRNFFTNSNELEKYIDSDHIDDVDTVIENVYNIFTKSCIYNPSVNRKIFIKSWF